MLYRCLPFPGKTIQVPERCPIFTGHEFGAGDPAHNPSNTGPYSRPIVLVGYGSMNKQGILLNLMAPGKCFVASDIPGFPDFLIPVTVLV